MTLWSGRTKPQGLVAVLLSAAAVLAAPVCAAAGRSHPAVVAGAACVTPACHALSGQTAGAGGSTHAPFLNGDCRSCHDLSLAAAVRFVRGAPSGPGAGPESARAWDLALCSGCHGEGQVARDGSPGTTGFSDGTRNLHALHVQSGRGRRCLPCHDPHAARQAKLLRERIPARGEVRIAQEFRGEPQGGWCKTGCHAPKRYARSPE